MRFFVILFSMNNEITNVTTGLTSAEVQKRPKNTPAHHVTDIELAAKVFKGQVISFFFILLIVSGVLSLYLGEAVDGGIFFGIAAINAIIGFFQEFRATKSTQALEKLVTHTVTVRRNGQLDQISSFDVVLGDIIIAEPGDIIVADVRVYETKDAFIDESVRTGETLPRQVEKNGVVYAGVNVVQGTIVGQVIAVGKESSIAQYADKIAKVTKNSSFEKFINSVSKYILIFTVGCLIVVFVVNVLVAHQITVSDYILYAVSMLVGVVPESLPLIVTIILTREALALARSQVIVKKLTSLQNLGSMNFLFTDKTGTVTENKLEVQELVDVNDLTNALSTISEGVYERTPMDSVFDTAIKQYLDAKKVEHGIPQELVLSPFQIARGYSVYTLPDGSEIIRGQYALVSKACTGDMSGFTTTCAAVETRGLRSIAFARRDHASQPFHLLGAVVFEDPLKKDAVEMYREIQDLAIDIKMITGDSTAVATYVGGLLDPRITAEKVYSMDNWKPNSTDDVEKYDIYARCSPDQKSILIDEHLDHGVVGFLGEGINDALALKRADIGFVVNNASDVARQSGDVILLERSLAPIIAAIKMSRKAFAHIRTYLLCTLTGNIGTLISLTAVIIFWKQIPMLPIQILLNNLLTDLPLMFIISDTVGDSIIKRPIRDEAQKFFKIIVIFALASSVFDFIFFFLFKGYDITVLRTGWFVFSVLAELTLVFSLRSELSLLKAPKLSKPLWVILVICYGIVLVLPFTTLGSVFHLVPLTLAQIGILLGVTFVYLFANELGKRVLFDKKA